MINPVMEHLVTLSCTWSLFTYTMMESSSKKGWIAKHIECPVHVPLYWACNKSCKRWHSICYVQPPNDHHTIQHVN
eukprot:1736327-Ditylum_brightwellii.AAC.1